MSTNHGLVFRRAPGWYKLIGFACFGAGGWLLWYNVELTLLGLSKLGVAITYAYPLGFAMAAIEAAVSIFVTQPENWDDIWAIVQSPIQSRSLPKLAKIGLSSFVLGLLTTILVGVYYFDFVTTYQGLFGNVPAQWLSSVIVLSFCLGTEVCSFFGFQALRMGKIAKLEALDEQATLAPRTVYAEEMIKHRTEISKAQAQMQAQQEWQQFHARNEQTPHAGGANP